MSETSEFISDQIAELNQEGPVEAPESDEATETPEKGNKAAREAAKYRTQLREAESQLETLNARIEGYQRAEVEQHLASRRLTIDNAEDFFALSKTTLADYLTDAGTVDTEKVQAAAHQLYPKYGRHAYDPSQGLGMPADRSGPSWSDMFQQ